MSRDLTDYDLVILKKLAPEMPPGKRHRSILPPLSKFYASSREDFGQRLEKLIPEELEYLLDAIKNGDECLMCLGPEYRDEFIRFVGRRVSAERAAWLSELIAFTKL